VQVKADPPSHRRTAARPTRATAYVMTQEAPPPASQWHLLRQSPLQWPALASILPALQGAFWLSRTADPPRASADRLPAGPLTAPRKGQHPPT